MSDEPSDSILDGDCHVFRFAQKRDEMKQSFATVLKCLFVFAGAVLSFGGDVQAKPLTIVASNLPGHFDKDGMGREADIVRTTLNTCGHSVRFIVQPFTRHWDTFKTNFSIDAVTTVPDAVKLDGFQTDTYIKYHNGVSMLSSSDLLPETVDDLKDKSVLAFMGALDILPGLRTASASFSGYAEKTDQLIQNRLLFANRVDAVVGDGLIFAEYSLQLRRAAKNRSLGFDPDQKVRFFPIFEPTPYHMVFRDEGVQQDFDKCYAELKAAGKIDEINNRYIDKYSEFVGSTYQGL